MERLRSAVGLWRVGHGPATPSLRTGATLLAWILAERGNPWVLAPPEPTLPELWVGS